ncbi:phosphoglucomutase [Lactifluus subvellereus]|nr:phosphoglucomutase [Lactifluus subvellereus]
MSREVPTKPFDGQKPGTSGLRKRVKVFQQEHYTENFVQAIFDAIPLTGSTLVVGGDGRFYSPEVVQIILRIASANGVSKVIIGKDGILSTPAASNVIRKYKANGGILLTASHNPGGPNADFGIKYNVENGGPAPENITERIFARTKTISSYKVLEAPPVDLSKLGNTTYGPLAVSIIDSVKDYLELLQGIFDFKLIRSFLTSHKSDFSVLFDGLHGVTGPYARAILLDALGLPESSIQNCEPSPDFGGGHPDPNLTYAHSLVEAVERDRIPFGAASDGDGDRNMIYGSRAFVTPSDSVAIIADWAEVIPYFKKGGIKGLARSMPTSAAIDLVAKAKGLEYFEVPTGWKFFGNLMDAGRLSICGEESFGTGSDHIREKDGLWAVIGAFLVSCSSVGHSRDLNRHYAKYGRSFFSRYDYEEVPSEGAQKLVDHVNGLINSSSFSGKLYTSSATGTSFTVAGAYNFDYTDPIDKSVSKNQGQVVTFSDGSRVVWRLSGTGSQGATVRMYVERYVAPAAGEEELARDTGEGLQALIDVALEISNLKEFLGREQPTVITKSTLSGRGHSDWERGLEKNGCKIERRYLVCEMNVPGCTSNRRMGYGKGIVESVDGIQCDTFRQLRKGWLLYAHYSLAAPIPGISSATRSHRTGSLVPSRLSWGVHRREFSLNSKVKAPAYCHCQ